MRQDRRVRHCTPLHLIPWIILGLCWVISVFGMGLSTGQVSKRIERLNSQIAQCEKPLPRNQICKLIAIPVEVKVQKVDVNANPY